MSDHKSICKVKYSFGFGLTDYSVMSPLLTLSASEEKVDTTFQEII